MLVLVEIINPGELEESGGNPYQMEVEPGTTVAQLGARFNLSPDLTYLALVNGEVRRGDYVLKDGDYVAFYSAVEPPESDLWMGGEAPLPFFRSGPAHQRSTSRTLRK